MRKLILIALLLLPAWSGCHVVMKKSRYPFYKTLVRLIYAIKSHDLHTYAVIDYKKNAKKLGKTIPSAVAILVSDPQLETYLLSKNPKIGLDLPIKIYIYKKRNGVFLTYHSPVEFKENYYIPAQAIEALERKLKKITNYAVR